MKLACTKNCLYQLKQRKTETFDSSDSQCHIFLKFSEFGSFNQNVLLSMIKWIYKFRFCWCVYDNLKWTFSTWNLWKYILHTYLYLLRNNTLNKEYLPSSSLARSPEILSWYYEMYSLYNLLHTHVFSRSCQLISFPWVFNLYQILSN